MDDELLDEIEAGCAQRPGLTQGYSGIVDLTILEEQFARDLRSVVERLIAAQDRFLGMAERERARGLGVLETRWSEPLDLLELLWLACRSVALKYQWRLTAAGHAEDVDAQAERQLFWTAHNVGYEGLVLLRNGLPAGALSRWRALCELEVRMQVLVSSGGDLARAYLDHDRLRYVRELRLMQGVLKLEGGGLPRADMAALEREATEIIARYRAGPDDRAFSGDYGWAHAHLLAEDSAYAERVRTEERPRGPTFDDMLVFGLQHAPERKRPLRWAYAEASSAVHGTPHAAADFASDGELVPWSSPNVNNVGYPAWHLASSLARITDEYSWRDPDPIPVDAMNPLCAVLAALCDLVLESVDAASGAD